MKPVIPLHDPRFKWIPAASHDADSTKFRERQLQRVREAQKTNIKPIRKTA